MHLNQNHHDKGSEVAPANARPSRQKIINSILISKPEYSIEDGWHVASAAISVNEKSHQLKFRVSEGPIAKGSEPFLAAALFPAMKIGQPLQVSGTISPKLLTATQTIQEIWHRWFPEYRKIPVQAETGLSDEERQSAEVGAFFSGGVDSFYTLLKHKDEITKIILMHGFDIVLDKTPLRARISKEIYRLARELKKPLIEVETNIFEFANQYDYHRNLLPSIGLLLAPQFRKIYIASNVPYNHTFPDSVHPLLDPLWSTEILTFVHDGCEADRIEKIAHISQFDIAIESLRVCFENRDDSYNCGKCEKCLRTMLALRALGIMDRCKTFDQKLDAEAVSHMKIREQLLPFAEENLRALESSGNNPELAEALRSCIKNYKYRELSRLINGNFGEFLASPQGATLVNGKRNTIFKALWQVERQWLLREIFKEKLKELDRKLLFGMFRRLYNKV
jgi:hypothetical protein